jgi:hypothetical protein
VSKPDLVSVYEEQWSSKWIPKLLVLARRSKSTIVQKALLDIEKCVNLDDAPGEK